MRSRKCTKVLEAAIGPREGQIRDEDDTIEEGAEGSGRQRLDKWLWYVRLAKTRSLAQKLIIGGHVRLNRERIIKPSQLVQLGDLVGVLVEQRLRLLRVAGIGTRRGPAPEAALLFEDLTAVAKTPPEGSEAAAPVEETPAPRNLGAGRPTKLERRQLDRLRGR